MTPNWILGPPFELFAIWRCTFLLLLVRLFVLFGTFILEENIFVVDKLPD